MKMPNRFPPRLLNWWIALRDRRKNLPSPAATTLGESEEVIRRATNSFIWDRLKEYGRKARPLVASLGARRDKRTQAKAEYEALCKTAGRHNVRIPFSRGIHVMLLSLLTLGEAAFNMIVFDIFREPGAVTMLCAMSLIIAIPVCAYHVGRSFRQDEKPWRRSVPISVVLASVLVAVSWFRVTYLQQISPIAGLDRFYWQIGYIVVNLVVVVATALVTYLSHDPVDGFAEAKEKFEELNDEIHGLEQYLRQLHSDLSTDVEILKEQGLERIFHYRSVNRRGREKVPRYFDSDDRNHEPTFVEIDPSLIVQVEAGDSVGETVERAPVVTLNNKGPQAA